MTNQDHSISIKRICPGEYEASCGDMVVNISRYSHLEYRYGQWISQAQWDRHLCTDPVIYLADAKRYAREMIKNALSGR